MVDEQLFDFFKNLECLLLQLQDTKAGYDDSKQLLRFLYGTFAGFCFIKGDIGYDIVEKMVEDL
tara:strand:+ start:2391 stop:2582 length:192 start_codon:yes stop_codon:yes gene_type:complete